MPSGQVRGPASDDHRRQELVQLIDQSGSQRMLREGGTTDAEVFLRCGFPLPHGLGIEGGLDPRTGCRR